MGHESESLIEIEDLHFSFGERKVFNGVNLKIPRGKVVAVLGVGGSGKSTLLRLIGGQLKPQRGRIRVNGQVVHELDQRGLYELRRSMGLMFQAGGLFSDMSVFDNIAFPMRERTDLPEELIHDLVLMKLHAVGLRGTTHLMPNELSGGMARRVALARAIALDPMLTMYDEPFAGLDPISLNVIAQLIRRLNDALRVTSIVVTYDVSESLKVVDYAYLLHDGLVQAEGTAPELLASAAPFVVQFLHAQPTGPVAFHMQSAPYREDLGLA
ncbi:ABC transporter ATP-binding protein [Sulfurisoma sediminicola]|uniref:Phospholipid/cholesterol/gamma-HCH transport system ATP-binding protein n=1 Tax=Sulfurisoma sediminicola TaxID=1381557 RepID=A0A497XJF9_9PROT|nr:ABC transporter ATP-binding protein [Sulfurisoma sediminicola]RLJ68051.1 phospholipid/cholesterol/gamma-HCH transport system ATP-binding protein [Sulfurisoma sediminicola]